MLRRALWSQRRDTVLGTALAIIHQACEAAVPVLVGVVIDEAISTGEAGALALSLGALAALFVVLSLGFRFGFRLVTRAQELAAHELRIDLVRRVLAPGGGADRGRLAGELLSIATADAQRVGAIHPVVAMGAGVLAAVTVAAVVLLTTSLPLGLLVVLGLPWVLVAAHFAAGPLQRRAAVEQSRAAHAAALATDFVRGLRVLKGLGGEAVAANRYRDASGASLDATLGAARAEAAYDAATVVLTGGFLVVVTFVAARLAVAADISVGELVATVGLSQFLVGPLGRVAYIGAELARARGSAGRIAEVLAAPPAVSAGSRLPALPQRGALRLRQVSLEGLRDVTADLPPGAYSAIVARPEEADALVRCLARDVDPDEGTIEFDGIALPELDLDRLRRAVLVARHDAELFSGTLGENLGDVPCERLERALAASCADEVAASLPDGLWTHLTESGRSLSGGQRQRVALARAIAADPAVLVLHDPTTAVDAATEARIATGLRAARRGRTTVVLTTSPALLEVSDHVVLLDGGVVADCGSHAELLRRSATYRTAVLG